MRRSAVGALFCLVAAVGTLYAEKPSGSRWLEKSKQANISAFEKSAYEQLAKIHLCKFEQHDHRGCFQVVGMQEDSPTEVLYRMGLDTLPILVEALDDETPTKTVTWGRRGEHPVWKVNELVARLIRSVADRDFEFQIDADSIREPGGQVLQAMPPRSFTLWGEGLRYYAPEDSLFRHAPRFKKLVLDWYAKNRKKTLAERKIADVNDGWFRNRLDALEWIAEHRCAAGKGVVLERIEANLKSSPDTRDLTACAFALGKIGDPRTTPHVHRVCQHLLEGIEEHGIIGSSDLYDLFRAYHGLALLGRKQEAIRELKELYQKCSRKWEARARQEFQEKLKAAHDW